MSQSWLLIEYKIYVFGSTTLCLNRVLFRFLNVSFLMKDVALEDYTLSRSAFFSASSFGNLGFS